MLHVAFKSFLLEFSKKNMFFSIREVQGYENIFFRMFKKGMKLQDQKFHNHLQPKYILMVNLKVLSSRDSEYFLETDSFHELCHAMKHLKKTKGRILLVLGAPGTGKSANIYQAISRLGLDFYNTFIFIDANTKPSEVFNIFWDTIEKDMGVKSKEETYKKVAAYDVVLFADHFLDSEHIDSTKMGLGLWTEENGPGTFSLYFMVLYEYLKHRGDLKNINLLFQTSWVVKFRGVRYDILTDFHFISRFLVFILKQFFDVVRISYSQDEIREIVRNHPLAGSDEEIEELIEKYGKRPRFIFEALENQA
ncbi:putative protein [Methanobacterium congolense]|uniref:Uncharacterized protein n=2 Tax=Methanobacterium congolense TaxID=118062 RepID=A0A1D3L5E9_9EURY|nr:putative protein [Methanobacterium congolense]